MLIPPPEAAPATGGDTANLGIQTRIEKQLCGRAAFERFSAHVLDGNEAAMSHAYALPERAWRFALAGALCHGGVAGWPTPLPEPVGTVTQRGAPAIPAFSICTRTLKALSSPRIDHPAREKPPRGPRCGGGCRPQSSGRCPGKPCALAHALDAPGNF